MRKYGALTLNHNFPVPADTVFQLLMTGGSSAQAQDWLSTGSTAMANAAAAGVGIVRLTGMTTAGGGFIFAANLMCTAAAVGLSSGLSSGGSTNSAFLVGASPQTYQVPGGSTGFSVAAATSGWVTVEMWKK